MIKKQKAIQAILFVGAVTLLLAAPALSHAENADAAQDVTKRTETTSDQDGRTIRRTRDGKVETYSEFDAGEALSFAWPEEAKVRTAYIKWYTLPDSVILVQTSADGAELSREEITQPVYNDCYPVLADARGLSIVSNGGMAICELTLYSEGTLPEEVHDWQPPVQKADLLVVSAHCDDEFIYFGGTIPYYAGERGLAVQVAYMANGDRARVDEALNGLWYAGVRNSPVFLPLKDVYTETLRLALLNWNEEETTATLVSLIRRFQPEVIVTHDLNGEYGHGAHMATATCMLNAVPLAADDAADTTSAAQFGMWQVQKLYLHLYDQNKITMDWNVPLDAFSGKTALEVANEAYHMHVSQLDYHSDVYGEGEFSSLEFGLAYTVVGQDEAKNDFFEHIDPARLTNYVAPTPTATPLPTPAQTAEPASTPAPEKEAPMQNGISVFLIAGISAFAAAFAAAIAVVLLRKKKNK